MNHNMFDEKRTKRRSLVFPEIAFWKFDLVNPKRMRAIT